MAFRQPADWTSGSMGKCRLEASLELRHFWISRGSSFGARIATMAPSAGVAQGLTPFATTPPSFAPATPTSFAPAMTPSFASATASSCTPAMSPSFAATTSPGFASTTPLSYGPQNPVNHSNYVGGGTTESPSTTPPNVAGAGNSVRPPASGGINNAAGATLSLDPLQASGTSTQNVQSAFEVLGLKRPNESRENPDQAERFIAALSGEKRSIPSWSGQPGSLRTLLKLLAHWESETTLPRHKWGIRLYQSFAESSEPRKIADQVDLNNVLSEQGYGMILTAIIQSTSHFWMLLLRQR